MEIGSIYAKVSADLSNFDRGMLEAATTMRVTAASMHRSGDNMEHDAVRTSRAWAGVTGAFSLLGAVASASVIPALIGIGGALVVVAALAAPILAVMGAVAALGAMGNVFSRWKDGTFHLVAGFAKVVPAIFDTVHKIATAVSKPLFHFLLGELRQLDAWVHTSSFRKGMAEIGKMLPIVAKAVIGAGVSMVKWYIAHWDTIKQILLGTLTVFGKIADGVKWLAKMYDKYWPAISNAVRVAYDWFIKNVWPNLVSAFHAIATVVRNLAHAFKQAWPQISAAIQTAWDIAHPILNLIADAIRKIYTAAKWLSTNAGPLFSGFATVVTTALAPVLATLNLVVAAINAVKTAASGVANFFGGSGPQAAAHNKTLATGKGVVAHASGGLARRGEVSLVGERGPELRVEGSNAHYVTAAQTKKLLSGGGGVHIHNPVFLTGDRRAAEAFARWLQPILNSQTARAYG